MKRNSNTVENMQFFCCSFFKCNPWTMNIFARQAWDIKSICVTGIVCCLALISVLNQLQPADIFWCSVRFVMLVPLYFVTIKSTSILMMMPSVSSLLHKIEESIFTSLYSHFQTKDMEMFQGNCCFFPLLFLSRNNWSFEVKMMKMVQGKWWNIFGWIFFLTHHLIVI